MSEKSISLVLATFNSVDMLEATLLANQSSGFKDIVVVDGESTDGTEQMIEDLKTRCSVTITFVSAPKRGLANARNIGTCHATGDIIMHAGPDNIIPAEVIESMVQQLDDYDLVSCGTRLQTAF